MAETVARTPSAYGYEAEPRKAKAAASHGRQRSGPRTGGRKELRVLGVRAGAGSKMRARGHGQGKGMSCTGKGMPRGR